MVHFVMIAVIIAVLIVKISMTICLFFRLLIFVTQFSRFERSEASGLRLLIW
jgi:hypothetical protein